MTSLSISTPVKPSSFFTSTSAAAAAVGSPFKCRFLCRRSIPLPVQCLVSPSLPSLPPKTLSSHDGAVGVGRRSEPLLPDVSSSSPAFDPFLSAPVANQTPGTAMRGAESDVMSLLLRERIVFLGSSIDDFVADAIISQLLLLDAQDHTKDIRFFINSAGGSLSATMAIYDVVQLVRADVSTIALGLSASTASVILGGGTKGKRLAMPNTRVMIHQPLGGASGQAIDVEIQAKEVMHNKENVTRIISSFSGRTFEQVQKDIDRDRYMSPMEAVEYGIVDGVIDRDSVIPLLPVPEKVKSRLNYDEMYRDPKKFLTPDIPDEEIY